MAIIVLTVDDTDSIRHIVFLTINGWFHSDNESP